MRSEGSCDTWGFQWEELLRQKDAVLDGGLILLQNVVLH